MPPDGKLDASGSPLTSSLPRELGHGLAVAGRGQERVVLLGGDAGQRLEPVRVVRGALLDRPVLERRRHRVGHGRVERLAVRDRPPQRVIHRLRQPLLLLRRRRTPGCRTRPCASRLRPVHPCESCSCASPTARIAAIADLAASRQRVHDPPYVSATNPASTTSICILGSSATSYSCASVDGACGPSACRGQRTSVTVMPAHLG